MNTPISVSVNQKPTLQDQKEPESTGGDPAKFNNLQVTVASEASIEGIREWLNKMRVDADDIKYVKTGFSPSGVNTLDANTARLPLKVDVSEEPGSPKAFSLISQTSKGEPPVKATGPANALASGLTPLPLTPLPDDVQARVDQETAKYQQLLGAHPVESTSYPPLEFRKMQKIERYTNCIVYRNMLKYHLNADGLLVKEKYTGSGNTVKQVSGVYVFNDIDEDFKGEFRLHQNGGLSDTHSIHAGQFNDGTFFLLALTKEMCDGHLIKYPFDSKKIGYFGDSYPATWAGNNTHSLYCGKTWEEAVKTFEQACKGTLVAEKIREILGFQPDSVGTRLEAQNPEQPEVPEPFLAWSAWEAVR